MKTNVREEGRMTSVNWREILVIATLVSASPATAQTMSFEDAMKVFVASCGKDMEKHCRGVNLGAGRLKACLEKNTASVSAQCKTDAPRALAAVQARADARVAVLKICEIDAQRMCGMVQKGDGQILECMLTAQRGTNAKCNQAITDAGYR